MTPIHRLDDDLFSKTSALLSPRSRACLGATDRLQAASCKRAANNPDGEAYYQDALAADRGQAGVVEEGSAYQAYQRRQQDAHAALLALRAEATTLATFGGQAQALAPRLSRRYGHVPAAHHGMDLLHAATVPAGAGMSPPRVRRDDSEQAAASVRRLLQEVDARAPGAAEAAARLAALPPVSLQLLRPDPGCCPPLRRQTAAAPRPLRPPNQQPPTRSLAAALAAIAERGDAD